MRQLAGHHRGKYQNEPHRNGWAEPLAVEGDGKGCGKDALERHEQGGAVRRHVALRKVLQQHGQRRRAQRHIGHLPPESRGKVGKAWQRLAYQCSRKADDCHDHKLDEGHRYEVAVLAKPVDAEDVHRKEDRPYQRENVATGKPQREVAPQRHKAYTRQAQNGAQGLAHARTHPRG